ncbi:hypothetical protein EZY14_016405 [Kordia sp. TARA_039_SRF]|nr:hypothetical protein EZY14_016405 [Kordia sp. TARA_039_SRF]
MARKKSKTIDPPINLSETEKLIAKYAENDAKINGINAKMDEELTAIREKYSEQLSTLKDENKENFERIQVFAETHPDLFKKKKTYETNHGNFGFRIGTPKLKARRGFTWAAVLDLIKGKKKEEFIRTKEEVAKDVLLAQREVPEVVTLMSEVGLEVIQQNSFFIDLKKEEILQ